MQWTEATAFAVNIVQPDKNTKKVGCYNLLTSFICLKTIVLQNIQGDTCTVDKSCLLCYSQVCQAWHSIERGSGHLQDSLSGRAPEFGEISATRARMRRGFLNCILERHEHANHQMERNDHGHLFQVVSKHWSRKSTHTVTQREQSPLFLVK